MFLDEWLKVCSIGQVLANEDDHVLYKATFPEFIGVRKNLLASHIRSFDLMVHVLLTIVLGHRMNPISQWQKWLKHGLADLKGWIIKQFI